MPDRMASLSRLVCCTSLSYHTGASCYDQCPCKRLRPVNTAAGHVLSLSISSSLRSCSACLDSNLLCQCNFRVQAVPKGSAAPESMGTASTKTLEADICTPGSRCTATTEGDLQTAFDLQQLPRYLGSATTSMQEPPCKPQN